MKAYGLPRYLSETALDCAEIVEGGRKSSVGRFRGKGGDYKNGTRNAHAKRATRRRWKRAARRAGKFACLDY